MKQIQCNIIVCGPAIGKSYLAEHDNRFIDIDEMKADYKYNLYGVSREEKEKTKLNRGETVNSNSSKYAIELLEKTIANNQVALISYASKKIMNYIIDKKYEYCLIYANKNLRDEYAERMKNRGNNSTFIEKMTNQEHWDEFYDENVNDKNAKYKIELKSGQYLSDIKDLFI